MSILIKNGRVIDPHSETDSVGDILVEGSFITRIGSDIDTAADTVIDAAGCFVMPGFIDLHVHLREPGFEYKETIKTGSMAAAAGGYTTICAMPNTKPVIDSPKKVEYVVKKAKEEAVINVLPIGAVTIGQEGREVTDIAGMKAAGACAISEDGKSVMDSYIYSEAMSTAAKERIPVFAHCEEINLVKGGVINKGAKSKELNLKGIPSDAEDLIVARDLVLAKSTGVKLHLCHCSTKNSVIMVKTAKEQGVNVTAEVCPHHFSLTANNIKEDDANYKMNPPLRENADVIALINGLGDEIIDIISTDHAPHSAEEKSRGLRKAPFGIVGLETAAALTMTNLVRPGYLTPMQMAERMSYAPADVINIDRGTLEEGKIADIVIFNPNKKYTIDPNNFFSKGKNTPFAGKEVYGKVETTIVNGKVVYNGKEIIND